METLGHSQISLATHTDANLLPDAQREATATMDRGSPLAGGHGRLGVG